MIEHNEKEVAFFGKITAGFTHEIKNILAIIKESSGLLEDILAVTEDEAFPHKDKFKKSLNRILNQIQRGDDITTHLNKFAHSPDHSPTRVDLNEMAEQVIFLAHRLARLKNVDLVASPHDASIMVKTHPVALQMALFLSIEIFLDSITSGGKIILSPRKVRNKHIVRIHHEVAMPDVSHIPPAISSSTRWKSLQEAMAYLGGMVETDGTALEILISLPESIDE